MPGAPAYRIEFTGNTKLARLGVVIRQRCAVTPVLLEVGAMKQELGAGRKLILDLGTQVGVL